MTTLIKSAIAFGVVAGLLGVIAFLGLSPFASSPTQSTNQLSVGSAAGTTFNTAKVATTVMIPAAPGATATTSSILNSDASDRKIESFKIDCSNVGTSLTNTGAGIATWQVSFATSSTATPAVNPNVNAVALVIATSTPDSFNVLATATSTPAVNRVWAAGSYLTIGFNATNTASCVAGVSYLGS